MCILIGSGNSSMNAAGSVNTATGTDAGSSGSGSGSEKKKKAAAKKKPTAGKSRMSQLLTKYFILAVVTLASSLLFIGAYGVTQIHVIPMLDNLVKLSSFFYFCIFCIFCIIY